MSVASIDRLRRYRDLIRDAHPSPHRMFHRLHHPLSTMKNLTHLVLLMSLLPVLPVASGAPTEPSPKNYVTVKDGKLMLDGSRVRFWGAIGSFPFPTAAENEALANRLDQLGFNMVRYWASADASPYKKGDGSRGDQVDYLLSLLNDRGFKVWMGALNGGEAAPSDVSILKDSGTAAAWTKSMTEWTAENSGKPVSLVSNPACIWDPRLEAIKLRHMQNVGNHINQYTGKRYADDSVFGVWELSNEEWWFGKMLGGGWQKLPAFFRDGLLTQWNTYLAKKYKTDDALVKAWGFLLPGESLSEKSIQLAPLRDPSKPIVLNDANPIARKALEALSGGATREQFTAARAQDVIAFLLEIWIAHKERLAAAVKSMGQSTRLAPLVWDTGIGYEIQSQYLQQHADAVAHCSYITGFISDPTHRRYPWLSGLDEQPRICGDVPWLEHNKIEGKPFLVYETQIEQPAKYRSEYPLRLTALAAIQNWDAINWHYFGQSVDLSQKEPYTQPMDYSPSGVGHPQGYHYQFDEVQMSVMRVAAEIMKHGLLQKAANPTTYTYGKPALLDPVSMDYGASYGKIGTTMLPTTYRHGLRIKIDPEQTEFVKVVGPTVEPRLHEPCPFLPTPEITYDWQRGYLKLDAPGVAAFTGFYANYGGPLEFANGITLEDVTLINPPDSPFPVGKDENYLTFTLATADGLPLEKTKIAWLSLVSTSFNTGFKLNESKLVKNLQWGFNPGAIENRGTLPVLVTRVGGVVKGNVLTGMKFQFLDFHFRVIASGTVPPSGLSIPADQPIFLVELTR